MRIVPLENFRKTFHRPEGRAHIVRKAVGKGFQFVNGLSERGGALVNDLLEFGVSVLEFFLHGAARSNVASHIAKPADAAGMVTNRPQDAGDKDPAPVFSDAPMFFDEVSILQSGGEHFFGLAAGAIFWSVKDLEALPRDFGGRVPVGVFCSGVPGLDLGFGVNGKDGEVLDVLKDQAVQLLA